MARKKRAASKTRRRASAAGYSRRRDRKLDRELTQVVRRAASVRDEIMERIAKGLLPKRKKRR